MLPSWVAVMVQVPAARVVRLDPVTVQSAGVPERKATGRPEVAVAVRVTFVPAAAPPGWAKVIIWVAWTWSDCVTSGAGA